MRITLCIEIEMWKVGRSDRFIDCSSIQGAQYRDGSTFFCISFLHCWSFQSLKKMILFVFKIIVHYIVRFRSERSFSKIVRS